MLTSIVGWMLWDGFRLRGTGTFKTEIPGSEWCVILKPMADNVMTLYRPVGRAEFELIRASGFYKFPPRLSHQPIFYPVLSEGYATQIARDWNTTDESSGFRGYVLRFKVRGEFLSSYEIHTVGSAEHREYWIPAEDLDALNENIVGSIEVISEFRGES
jgi:hypothetical protein